MEEGVSKERWFVPVRAHWLLGVRRLKCKFQLRMFIVIASGVKSVNVDALDVEHFSIHMVLPANITFRRPRIIVHFQAFNSRRDQRVPVSPDIQLFFSQEITFQCKNTIQPQDISHHPPCNTIQAYFDAIYMLI